MGHGIAIGSLIVLLFVGASSPEPTPAAPTKWLTTRQLERLLTGSRLVQINRPKSYMRNPEEFRSSGTYVRHEDNFEARGTFRFNNNRVCVIAERDPEVCRRILVDSKGAHWIELPHAKGRLERVSVTTLR